MRSPRIQRALISVSDKSGLGDFARGLQAAGVEIYSTGGTARYLREIGGVTIHDITNYTGFPELMDGRLKTLHPRVFGGILCRPDRDDDLRALQEHEIVPFELVAVNLYPFEETIAVGNVALDQAIEQIDIGGPSLLRAAAKNHAFVTVAASPEDYAEILDAVTRDGATSLELRQRLAAQAFIRTASYDRAIHQYLARPAGDELFPEILALNLQRQTTLRYGENPHQAAALYACGRQGANLVAARQLNGKELSYNNLLDLDSALAVARSLPRAGVAVIKHNNPCGAASSDTLADAARHAIEGDPISAFGSVLGFNQAVDVATAEFLSTPGLFVEAMVAPRFDDQAVRILTTRPKWRANVRLMQVGSLDVPSAATHYRCIEGGMLLQQSDCQIDDSRQWRVVTDAQPNDSQMADVILAWTLVRHVKSNAIVLCRDQALCGVGAGQMSRIDSVQIAIQKAGARAPGCVLASDAFFPFPDAIERAAQAGVAALIQPGGSKGDHEVIDACNRHQLPMVFTGRRHFKH